jgi:hypothetical protein
MARQLRRLRQAVMNNIFELVAVAIVLDMESLFQRRLHMPKYITVANRPNQIATVAGCFDVVARAKDIAQ